MRSLFFDNKTRNAGEPRYFYPDKRLSKRLRKSKRELTLPVLAVLVLSLLLFCLPGKALASTSQEDFDAYYADESYEGEDDVYYDYYSYHDRDADLGELSGTDFELVTEDNDLIDSPAADADSGSKGTPKVRCRVVEVMSEESGSYATGSGEIDDHIQKLKVKVKEGKYKGLILNATYNLSDAWGGGNAPKPAKVGNLVICQFVEDDYGQIRGEVVQFGRENSLLFLAILFLVLLTLFGGKRGLRSIIALVVTCVGLVCVMIPAMVHGMNAVLAAICAGIFAVAVTLTIIYGFTVKTVAAALGAWGGLIMAGIITAIMNATMHMTGLVDDESMYLAQSVGDGSIDLRGILFAAILIGTLGGTIDVGISIASALDELREKAGANITGVEMMKSGISIGIDIMGASLNTLILSYVGSSIHLLMLFYTYDNPFVLVINDEMIACELLRSLAGSIGLLLTVPITSFVSAVMMNRGNFGKLDADCFQSVVLFKRLKKRVSGGGGKSRDGGQYPEGPEHRGSREGSGGGQRGYDGYGYDGYGEDGYGEDGYRDNARQRSEASFRQRGKRRSEPEEVPDNLFARAQQHYDEFDDDLPDDVGNGNNRENDDNFSDYDMFLDN